MSAVAACLAPGALAFGRLGGSSYVQPGLSHPHEQKVADAGARCHESLGHGLGPPWMQCVVDTLLVQQAAALSENRHDYFPVVNHSYAPFTAQPQFRNEPGYVQHDLPPAATTLLLDELADTLAPAVATHSDVLYAVDDESRTACFGEAALYLGHQHAIAFSCRHDEETLAVALLFRSEEEPFDESALDCAAAIAPMIGERLARIIRVHRRTTMDFFEN